MSKEPTLIILIPGFPKNENDSTCLPAQQNLVLHINKLYPSVRLLILSFQYPFEKKEYNWNGNKVIAFGGKNKGSLWRRWLWLRVRRKLNELKKYHHIIGVLNFWAGECAYIGTRWARKNNITQYSWVMGQDAKSDNKFVRLTPLKGEELIAISDLSAAELKKNHKIIPENIIPLGISPQQLPGTKKRNIDILCAGSLIPLKQYHLCIDIARELKKQFPNIRMLICGNGPEKERLDTMIKEYDLIDNVLLGGEKEHDELLGLMKQTRIFLHPSSYEGLGVVCLEALAAGTPVVSFYEPMNEPIRNWYKVDSVEAMIKKLIELLAEPIDHQPVHPYTMQDTTRCIMTLFGITPVEYIPCSQSTV